MIVIIIGIILISGCQGTYSNQNFRTGTEGVVVEFNKNTKNVVYEREEFGNIIFIKNKGATDITAENPAVLKVAYDDYRITMVGNSHTVAITGLEGKNPWNPVGSEEPFETYFRANLLTNLREAAETEITYNLCYPYVTELTAMTCIDTNTATRSEEAAACKSETYNGGSGQGAPIVITKIVPEIQLQSNYVRPQFNIYIENRGTGYVTSADSCTSGNADITNGDIVGIVNVEAWVSGMPLQCGPSGSGTLKLSSSESFIKCYLPLNANGYSRDQKNYLTPLTVRATYTYISISEQQVEIKRDSTIIDRPEEIYDIYDENTIAQGKCSSFQVEYNGGCISKCEYCAKNPNDDQICGQNKPFDSFTFNQNFACACGLEKCNQLSKDGKCIKGYCPGNVYCCAANNCAEWQVSFNGECVDTCDYCATHLEDTARCGKNTYFQGQKCIFLTNGQVQKLLNLVNNKTASDDVLARYGYGTVSTADGCDFRNKYHCLNEQFYYEYLSPDNAGNAAAVSESDSNDLCSFCAGNGDCTFTNNGIEARISSDFSCSCGEEDSRYLESYNFVPEAKYCNNGLYCCKKPG